MGEGHEVDVPEAGACHVGSEDEAHVPGEAGQHVRSLLHHVIDGGFHRPQLLGDRGRVPGMERVSPHEGVHVDPIALVGGDPARARVRMVEVAQCFEVGHDVAQGGRGEASIEDTGEALRPHRLPRLDVELYEGAKDFLSTLVQNRRGHRDAIESIT